MKVLIVEDEYIAYEKLKMLLRRVAPECTVVGNAKSVKEGIDMIENGGKIDLAFFDIQLQDGLSFSILESISINLPIIFTTAYDDYAIRAFDHHSIAYLLKPIQKVDLEKALDKFKTMSPQSNYAEVLLQAIQDAREVHYKERFTVKVGNKIRLIDAGEISCFYSRDKGTYIYTTFGKHYLLDNPIDRIEGIIDPAKFFRINRKHLIHISEIEKIIQFTNSRLKIVMKQTFDEELIVAREKVKAFKEWLEG